MQMKITRESVRFLTQIKIELMSFKSSEHINEEGDVPYRTFTFGNMEPKRITVILQLSTG